MKISIITVCLNSERTIEKTIKSILLQKHKNIEYIIVDGGSSDNTIHIIDKYRSKIHKFISENDRGIYDAINKGINHASGEIISILHSDDYFANDQVLTDVAKNFLNDSRIDCLIGNTVLIKNGKKIRNYSVSMFKTWMMFFGISPAHPSSFFKKKIYDKFGLYKSYYNIAGDFEFFLRTLYKNKIKYKKKNLTYVIMQYGGESTKSYKSNFISSKEILKSFKENHLYNNFFFINLRFPIKVLQFIFK